MHNIRIEFIQHKFQRYDTAGDWFYDHNGDLVIRVSIDHPEFAKKEEHYLVALHELIEALSCDKNGINQDQVDEFDMGVGQHLEEPGEHKDAPYRKEHMFAMLVENLIAHEWGVD